jgi:hypothetical protein
MKRICIFISLAMLALTGCMGPSVQAQSFYTSRRDLASYVIDTPDPEKSTKRLGQKIWVTWHTPRYDEDTRLDVSIRFVDGRERKEVHPITSKIGEMYIQISPREVAATDGLLSYKIQLMQKDQVLATTKHKLWVEKIEISEPNK